MPNCSLQENINRINELCEKLKFETAKRLCEKLLVLDEYAENQEFGFVLHRVYRGVQDYNIAIEFLKSYKADSRENEIERLLLLGEDYYQVSDGELFKVSEESLQGYCFEEYEIMKRGAGDVCFKEALALCIGDEDKKKCGKRIKVYNPSLIDFEMEDKEEIEDGVEEVKTARLSGRIFMENGEVAVGKVTIGLKVNTIDEDPATYFGSGMHYSPTIGKQKKLETQTNEKGEFVFENVPVGKHEFLAITLDPLKFDICTHYLEHNLEIERDETREYIIKKWKSAPTYEVSDDTPEEIQADGYTYKKIKALKLHNPFYYDFPNQIVSLDLEKNAVLGKDVVVYNKDKGNISCQTVGDSVSFFAELKALSDSVYSVYATEKATKNAEKMYFEKDSENTAVIDTGAVQIKVPINNNLISGPIVSIRKNGGKWRGKGRLVVPNTITVTSQETKVLVHGELILTLEITYTFSNNSKCIYILTAHKNEKYAIIREVSVPIGGLSYEFSIREFSGGRGCVLLLPAVGSLGKSWENILKEDIEYVRLQETIPWGVKRTGLAYSVTSGEANTDDDFISVFTLRRGEWIDRKFEKVCNGPKDNYELDWPYPEMVGSNISMITFNTDKTGDAFYKFKAFDGERVWGISASTLELNDGIVREISTIQHKLSSPRLQEFKDWIIDSVDDMVRPCSVADKKDLINMRKKKDEPVFKDVWERLQTDKDRERDCREGVRFAVDGDPLLGWRIKHQIVEMSKITSRMLLLGRDYSDKYCPVGVRDIGPTAENFDLIAASGVFTPEEERIVRDYLILAAYILMEPDFMNWKFNGRNANFEADRIKVVGNVGIVFNGHPCSDVFVDHVIGCIKKTIDVYTTPNSGKWYENPACYYMTSLNARMSVIYKLVNKNRIDITQIPKFKEFLSWGLITMTPKFPHNYEALKGYIASDDYKKSENVRRIPPIGDHARLGLWISEYYAVASKIFKNIDPEFSDFLMWSFIEGGMNGGHMGEAPAFFCQINQEDLKIKYDHTLESRILQGFGSVYRNKVGTDEESYLLFKMGPGGYRFHRTEGSIIYFADGKPIIFDGGEAGETWRHTTLSFYDIHLPLAPGHIERYYENDNIWFSQGVNPTVIKPGDPVFLSDKCDVELIDLAYERFNEPFPANSRSILMVKDEYFIIYDELDLKEDIPSYWHLQAVAEGEEKSGYEYIFKGRYGTDLQVILPDQTFKEEKIEWIEHYEYHSPKGFTMRHLQLKGKDADHYLAVIRPLGESAEKVTAKSIFVDNKTVGVEVEIGGYKDLHFFNRGGMDIEIENLKFKGKYLSITNRNDEQKISIIDGDYLKFGDCLIECCATSAEIIIGKELSATVNGAGGVKVSYKGKDYIFKN